MRTPCGRKKINTSVKKKVKGHAESRHRGARGGDRGRSWNHLPWPTIPEAIWGIRPSISEAGARTHAPSFRPINWIRPRLIRSPLFLVLHLPGSAGLWPISSAFGLFIYFFHFFPIDGAGSETPAAADRSAGQVPAVRAGEGAGGAGQAERRR